MWEANSMNGYFFKTSLLHLGIGMAIWPDGRKYVGNYVKDKKEGNGTF